MAIICREHKLLFIMVPGTGCSTVGKALQNKLGGTFLPERPLSRNGHTVERKHNTVPELVEHGLLSEEERKEYLVFASVRNPFDRWVTYFQRYEGDWLDYYERVSRRRIERDQRNFDLSDEEVEERLEQRKARLQTLRRRQRVIRALGFNVWMIGTLLRWALNADKGGRGDISRYAFPMLDGVDMAIRQERLNEGLNRVLEIAGVDRRVELPERNATSGKKPYTEYYARATQKIGKLFLGREMDSIGYNFEGPTDSKAIVRIREKQPKRKQKKEGMIEKIKDAARAITPDSVWGRLRAYRRPLNLHETARFNFFPVSHDPLVIYTFTGWELGLGNVFHMSRSLDRPAAFVVGFTRYANEWKLRFLRRQFDRYRARHSQNRIVLIANSKEELDRMRRFGFDARFVNKNAFQREDQFAIREDEEKTYDAVMTARMARWKRIELARKIDRLAIITVVDEEEYYSEMRDVLPDTTSWMNFDNHGNYRYLSRSEVCRILNRSRTGLILSAREANNKASIEYLLSGVPVVSTPSKGGRDVFFDKEYCVIVEAKPDAVREGVESMAARDIDPEYIRQQTLGKIRDHRARFLSLVSDLTEGHYEASVDNWLDLYPRNMKFRCQPEHFRPFLESEFLRKCPEFRSSTVLREHQPERWRSIVNGMASSRS